MDGILCMWLQLSHFRGLTHTHTHTHTHTISLPLSLSLFLPCSSFPSPVIGAYHATNVTITGQGVVNGQGAIWWENCTKCHYTPGNESSFCEIASRPKLIETQVNDCTDTHGRLRLQEMV